MADAEGRKVCGVPERAQLHAAMLALQFGYAGFHVVSRLALNMGISKLVFPVYRNIIALVLLLPFAYFLEKKDRPRLTLSFVAQFFFLALCGVLPSGLGQHVADIRLRHPELRPGHHLRHGRSAPDREGSARPAGRRGEGGGHAGLRGGRVGDHALQGPHHLRAGGLRGQCAGVLVGGDGRRGQELDAGVRVPDRALPVVVGVAGAAGAGAQEVPGAPLRHVLHLLLRRHPVPRHRRLHGEGRRRMGLPLRLRDLHHPLRRFHRLRRGVRRSDMVRTPRRSGVRGRVPARPDARRRHHGLPHPRREVLPRRDHWRRSDRHRSVPGVVGQERREGARRQGGGCCGGGGHGVSLLRRAPRRPERQGLLHHPAPPAASLHLLRQRLNRIDHGPWPRSSTRIYSIKTRSIGLF